MEPLVRKRSGKVVPFSRFRIINAIYKAMKATNIGTKADAERVADAVALYLYRQYFKKGDIPHVETIQDVVEKTLMEMGFHEVAKAYILYREKRRQAREIGKALVDGINLIEEYLGEEDWRVKENSNMGFSLQGLNFHVSSSIVARYWLEKLYPEDVARAHKEGDFHIHDLGILGPYCVGWDLYDLLLRGFGGVSGKVESKPAKHFRSALGQIVNFLYTMQGEAAGAQAFSFDGLTPITIRRNGEIESVTLEMLFNDYKHHAIRVNGSEVIYTEKIYRRYLIDDADKRKYMDTRLPTEPILFQMDKIEVLSEDGFVPLMAISRHKVQREDDKLLIIETEDGNVLRITKAHPVILSNGEIIRADKLRIGDEILSTNNINIPITEEIDLEENFAYLIGFMIAEGCWGHQTKEYAVVSQKVGKVEREKVENILQQLNIPYHKEGDFNIVFSTTRIGRFIRNHLHLQNKSYRKNLPNFIFRLSKKSISALISGLIDGDGDVDRNRIVRIHSTSYTLLMQLKQLLNLLGINATVRCSSSENMNLNYRDNYVIRFRLTEEAIRFFNHSLKIRNIFPKKKQSPLFSSKVVKILEAKANDEYVYDITTQNQHFLINNLVVHNSNFDTLLAPFVSYDKLSYDEVKQCMQEFLFNMNVPTRTGFQVPFTNLTFDLKPSKLFANTNVIIGGKIRDELYEEFYKEMSMINRAFCELMMAGDAKGRIFTFPIPTYNITKDFDWDNPEYEPLWEMTRKYGIPYFANFVNSDMDPEDARSMCIDEEEEVLIRNSKKIKRISIRELVEDYKKGDFDEEGWAECKEERNLELLSLNPQTLKLEWVPVKRFLKIKDDKAVKVITEDGKSALFSFKHPVPVYTPNGIKMKFAKDLQKGDYLLTLKKGNEFIFSTEYQKIEDLVLDENLAKILGYFVADGNYLFESRKGYTHFGEPRGMQFTFKTGDRENLEVLKSLIKKVFNLPTYEKQDPRYNTYYLYIYNTEIARKLYRAGFKKYGRLPQILFNSPKSVIESFLEFYFKGDGYERRKEIHLNDFDLSRDLVLLFSLVGKPVTYKLKKKSQRIYLQHSKTEIKKGNGWLNNPVLAERVPGWMAISTYKVPGLTKSRTVGLATLEKYNANTEESLKIKDGDIYLVKIKDIEIKKFEKPKEFYDVELERNHLFVHSLGFVSFNCCRLRLDQRELRRRGGGLFGAAPLTGSIGVVTINLPRIGYLSTCEEEFFERLESLMELAKISLEIKRKVVEDFTEKGLYPYSKFYLESIKQARGQYWANHFSTIGVVGMNEMCLNFLNKPIYEESSKQFAIKVLKFMRDKLADFQQETGNLYNLEATPAESSLAPNEKVLISQSDPELKEIGPLIDEYMEKNKERILVIGKSEILPLKEGELYTYGFSLRDLKIKRYPVTSLIRHPGDSMYEIETVSGRKVRVTKYHSVFTLGEDGLPKEVKVESLKKGDIIAIPKKIEMENLYQEFNLIEEFKKFPQIRENLYLKTTSDFIETLLADEKVRDWVTKYYKFPFKDVKYQWRKKKVLPLKLIYNLNVFLEKEVLKNSEVFYRKSKNTFPIKPLIPINKDLGFLLGAILAEGWIGKDRIEIVNTSEDFIKETALSAEKVFGSFSFKVTSRKKGKRGKPLFVLTLLLLPTLFIKEVLNLKGKSWQKSIPSFAYFSFKEFVAGLLKGFFGGDGSKYIKQEKSDYNIRLYTNSEELKDGLNLLLLKLGILAKIKEDKKDRTHKNRRRNYILVISGIENLQKFYQLVLEKEFKGKVKNSGREKIPQIIQNLKRLVKNAGLKKEELEKLGIWQGTFDRCVRKNSISLNHLKEVIEKLSEKIKDPLLENLKILVEGDLYWDPIKSIKKIETPKYVYDFEVDVEGDLVQNFLGGEGLVCLHNTAYRLAKIDKKKFPRIKTAGTDNSPYYTNSCHLPVNYTDDIFEILKHQDDLQTLFTGGTVVHLFVGEEIADRRIVKDLVRTIVENFRLPYFSITPTFSVCPVHGYLSGKHEICPYPHTEEEIEKFGIEIEVPLSLLTKLPEKAYKIS